MPAVWMLVLLAGVAHLPGKDAFNPRTALTTASSWNQTGKVPRGRSPVS
jgi:hypothetical protein